MQSLSVSASSEFPLPFRTDCSGLAKSTSSASGLVVAVLSIADAEDKVELSVGSSPCGCWTSNPGGANIVGDGDGNACNDENVADDSHDEDAAPVKHCE